MKASPPSSARRRYVVGLWSNPGGIGPWSAIVAWLPAFGGAKRLMVRRMTGGSRPAGRRDEPAALGDAHDLARPLELAEADRDGRPAQPRELGDHAVGEAERQDDPVG